MKWFIYGFFAAFLAVQAIQAVFGGHIPSKTGIPGLDNTVWLAYDRDYPNNGGGSGVVVAKYPNPDRPEACQVDLLTANHVPSDEEWDIDEQKFKPVWRTLYVDGQPFKTWTYSIARDLALVRGVIKHSCSALSVVAVKDSIRFMEPIWRTGYPFGQRDYQEGVAGECTYKLHWAPDESPMHTMTWCMHSIAGGGGASGSGIYSGPFLVGIVQLSPTREQMGPYMISVHPKHIAEFLDYAYKRTNAGI